MTVAALDTNGCPSRLLTVLVAPICVPPVRHVACAVRSSGPQRKNFSVPVQVDAPVMFSVAESVNPVTMPAPIDTVLTLGVVLRPLVHFPKLLMTKSFNCAVVDVDERVSEATVAKHSPERPSAERLMPPS